MARTIVVNAGISETRVAVLDNGILSDLSLERKRHRSIVGNVYKGVVTNVLPGMQAAFVDIGLNKDAFLYAGDFTANVGEYERLMLADDEADIDDLDDGRGDAAGARPPRDRPHRGRPPQGPEHPGPGVQGVARHQGRPDHLLHQPARPVPRLHAPGQPPRGLAADPRRRRAGPAAAADQGDPAARGRRVHHPDRRRGEGRGRVPGGRRVPACASGSRSRPGSPRPRPARRAPRGGRPHLPRDPRSVHRRGGGGADRRRRGVPAGGRVRREPRPGPGAPGPPLRGPRARLRGARHREGDREGAPPQGLAQVGRLPGHRPDRGPGLDRRQHRQVRRQARLRGDDPQDQPGGGERGGPPDPPPGPRRDHHHRLHRHGARGAPPAGVPRAQEGPRRGQVADQRARDLRAGHRRDDPQAGPPGPPVLADGALSDLQGQRRGEVAGRDRRRDLPEDPGGGGRRGRPGGADPRQPRDGRLLRGAGGRGARAAPAPDPAEGDRPGGPGPPQGRVRDHHAHRPSGGSRKTPPMPPLGARAKPAHGAERPDRSRLGGPLRPGKSARQSGREAADGSWRPGCCWWSRRCSWSIRPRRSSRWPVR